MKRIILLLVCLSLPIPALADTHYVHPLGSNHYPYTSWASGADSIQKAINAASPCDTVRVWRGTYREMIMMIPGITLIGAGMDSSIIYPYKNSGRDIIYGQDSSVIEGFHIRGWEPEGGDFCAGIYNSVDSRLKSISNNKVSQCNLGIGQTGTTEVSNNIFENNKTGIASDFGDRSLIINNTFIDNHWAISMWVSAGPRIIKNIFFTNSTFGRAIYGDFTDSMFVQNNLIVNDVGDIAVFLTKYSSGFVTAPITNNTIIGNPWHASIHVTFGNEIKNNILSDGYCAVYAYRPGGYACNPQVSYNDVWNNVQPYCAENGASIDTSLGGNIYLDPMFVGGDDYHLQYGSPCIDAGDPNVKDPDSSRSDMGCYGGAWGEIYTYQDYPPKAPDSLKAVSLNTVIVLSWKPNTESDLSHYSVYRDTIPGFVPDEFNIVGIAPKDSSVFRDYYFVLGKTYYYRVSAWDQTEHESEYSDELEVMATSVVEYTEEETGPPRYRLFQNYPNPFNSSTMIWYYLPDVGYQPAEVEISIYNVLGELVRTLVKKREYPGQHKVMWNGRDDGDSDVGSGVYFCRLKVSGLEMSKPRKMVLVK